MNTAHDPWFPNCECRQRGHERQLKKIITRKGRANYAICCNWCNRRGQWLAYKHATRIAKLQHGHINNTPTLTDSSCRNCQSAGCPKCTEPCERCGSYTQTENHHWAPQHLFEDAWQWPQSTLCRTCHMLWHSIVTPNMTRKPS